jgi:hypothetical protein
MKDLGGNEIVEKGETTPLSLISNRSTWHYTAFLKLEYLKERHCAVFHYTIDECGCVVSYVMGKRIVWRCRRYNGSPHPPPLSFSTSSLCEEWGNLEVQVPVRC